MEKTPADRRFRNAMFAGMCLLLAGYGIYKFHMITLALSVWDGQVLEVRPGLAAK